MKFGLSACLMGGLLLLVSPMVAVAQAQEASAQEASAQEASAQEASAQEASAQEASAQVPTAPAAAPEELSFDEVPEVAVPSASSVSHWYDTFHLAGRFDLNFELDDPLNAAAQEAAAQEAAEAGTEDTPSKLLGHLKNYHHFLFLKATPTPKLSLEAELIDLSYYEIRYKVNPSLELKFGKIWVPFGGSAFHHYYGGRQGNPFQGLLLPNVWAEYGATANYTLLRGGAVSLEGDTFLVRGFDGAGGTPLALNIGGTDGRFALGQRLRIGLGSKVTVWASALYNRWGLEHDGRLLLWGGDLKVDYGLFPVPFLKDFALRMALARAEIRDPALDPGLTSDGWYWRYGDYLEVDYAGLRPYTTLRLRYGTVIDYNLEVSVKDVHNWTLAALTPLADNFSLLLEYQWNMEEIDEVHNDLFRAQAVVEF